VRVPQTRDQVRSDEEYHFILWLQEATRHGLVEQWHYEGRTFNLIPERKVTEAVQLKTKQKSVERHVHREATYTPDFGFVLTQKGRADLYDVFKLPLLIGGERDSTVFVDVKGTFQPVKFGSDGRYFSLIQKLVLMMYPTTWVQKVVPQKLFAKTWCPEALRWMKNRKTATLTAIGKKCKSVDEFINATGEPEGATK